MIPGPEIIPRTEVVGAYHLAKNSGNFGLKSNGKEIFRKFRSEIVEYLQRYSSFSIRNGTTEISLPFGKFSSFQSLIMISRKQIARNQITNGERYLVRSVCRFWKNPSYHYSTVIPTRFILTNGKHPVSLPKMCK